MLDQLAQLLKTRKGKYILFLGAGASVSSGGRTTKEIVAGIVEKYNLDSRDPWNSFCSFLKRIGGRERFDILSPYFENMKPSPGYRILAELIEGGYFRLILTTNFDYMLEEALKETKLVLNKDYFICIVKAEKEDVLENELEDESMIRIIKLHGDYKRKILPFTEEETFRFEEKLEECLKRLTKEGIIFVGYSGMDSDVLKCLSLEGESVWWVNPKKVTADTTVAEKSSNEYSLNKSVYRILEKRASHQNYVWGEYGISDTFFEKIHEKILVRDINGFCDQFRFGAPRYRKMKDLFEPPYQYDEMKRKLNQYRVLVILGEAHLGKTYTALNLLYDYYVEGFSVEFWSELYKKEMQEAMMYQWEDLLKPNTVIYLEDPFGKTESDNTQIFRSELKRTIQRIKNSESMVIITSRLNIFREVADPDEFPMIVELMKHDVSYDIKKRKKIIDKYVAVYKPAWRELLNKVAYGSTLREWLARELTEPHNIELFIEKSLDVEDIDSLLEKAKESKEILEVFKTEVEKSTLKEKIFLYLCYVFQGWWVNPEDFKRFYPRVANVFNLDACEDDLDGLLKKLEFRVENCEGFFGPEIKFSHPDFSRAIEVSFDGNATVIGKILGELAKDEDSSVRRKIAEIVGDNFEKLTEDYRRILFELARDEDCLVRGKIAEIVGDNLEKFTGDYRRILFDLAKDEDSSIRKWIARIVGYNFEKFPEDHRNLLFDLAKDEDSSVREWIARSVGDNFEKLTEDYRRILLELAKDEDSSVREWIARSVGDNFEKLTEDYRRILFDLAKDEDCLVREWVSWIVDMNLEKLTEDYRRILFELAKDEDCLVREDVARTIGHNFGILSEDYRRILFELAKDEDNCVRGEVARTISDNFEDLSENYRKLLLTLSEDKAAGVRMAVALAVRHKIESFPPEYQRFSFDKIS